MTDNKPYELERDSRIMSYLPGGKSIGGMIDAVELTLDELSDDHFETVKALIAKIRAHKFNPEEIGISGDFTWHIEIGPKHALAQDLTTIFASQSFQVLPSELFQLQDAIKKGLRDAAAQPPKPSL
ncbi:MAG: hypothetical protein VXW91_04385 [Pseudomonadota bacterium]|nr:hypothetical protein [Pseudomonadota bacterium]MEC8665178.1 hypothetical protein [Pseudomonadota bacterium]